MCHFCEGSDVGLRSAQVASTFLLGLEGTAQDCINSLPSLKGASDTTAVTDQLKKCCPLIKKARPTINAFLRPGPSDVMYIHRVLVC